MIITWSANVDNPMALFLITGTTVRNVFYYLASLDVDSTLEYHRRLYGSLNHILLHCVLAKPQRAARACAGVKGAIGLREERLRVLFSQCGSGGVCAGGSTQAMASFSRSAVISIISSVTARARSMRPPSMARR